MEADLMLDALLTAAREHGENGDPDQEAGDLIDLVLACWARLTPAQRTEVEAEIIASHD